MPVDKSINYVELPGADFAALERFYAAAFGWTFTSYGPEYHAFTDASGFNGGFFQSTARSVAAEGATLVVLYAAQLEAARDAVSAAGGTIAKPIFSFPGGRRFHFHDPHGNELAVWSDG